VTISRSDVVRWWEPRDRFGATTLADLAAASALTLAAGAAWSFPGYGIALDGSDDHVETDAFFTPADYAATGFTLFAVVECQDDPQYLIDVSGSGDFSAVYHTLSGGRVSFALDAFNGGLNAASASGVDANPPTAPGDTRLYLVGLSHDGANAYGFTLNETTAEADVQEVSAALDISALDDARAVRVGLRKNGALPSAMVVRRIGLLGRKATRAELVSLVETATRGGPMSYHDTTALDHRDQPWVVPQAWRDLVAAAAQDTNVHVACLCFESHGGGVVKDDDDSFGPMFVDALREALGTAVGLAGIGLGFPKNIPVGAPAVQSDTKLMPGNDLDFSGWSACYQEDRGDGTPFRAAAYMMGGFGTTAPRAFLNDNGSGTLGVRYNDALAFGDFTDLGLIDPLTLVRDTTLVSARVHLLEDGGGAGNLDGMGYDGAVWRVRQVGAATATGSQQTDTVVASFGLGAGDVGLGVARGGATDTNMIVVAMSAKAERYFRVGLVGIGGIDPVDDFVDPHLNTLRGVVSNDEIDVVVLPVATTNAASAGRSVEDWWQHYLRCADTIIDHANANTAAGSPLVAVPIIWESGSQPANQRAYNDRLAQWALDRGYMIWNLARSVPSDAEAPELYDSPDPGVTPGTHLKPAGYPIAVSAFRASLGLAGDGDHRDALALAVGVAAGDGAEAGAEIVEGVEV
jgi:hypothetical protein